MQQILIKMAKRKKRTTYGYQYWGGGAFNTAIKNAAEFMKNNPALKEELTGLSENVTGLANAVGGLSDKGISAEQAIGLPSNMYGLGGISTAVSELTNDINLAKGLDTSQYEKKVNTFGNQGVAASDNQELLQAMSNRNRLNNVNKYDITGGNLAKDIIGGIGSFASSAINGFTAGGVPGLIASGAANLIGQGVGIFNTSKNMARLNNAIDVANARQDRAFADAARNIRNKEKAAAMVNFAAFGGPLYDFDSFGGGAIGYNIAMDNLMAKRATKEGDATGYIPNTTFAEGGGIHIKPSKRGTFTAAATKHGQSVQAFASHKWHADGGMLFSNNFTNGVNFIGNGGTHEQNPHQGVPMGIAPDGKPNLVEEGEVEFNNYIFSNRLRVPKEVRNKYKLRGPKNMTFAEAFEVAQKESAERENDPISKNGLENIAMILARTQEAVRGYERAKGHQAAKGGHLFVGGGPYDYSNMFGDLSYQAANSTGYLPYDRKFVKSNEVKAIEDTADYNDYTQYVLDNWDDPTVQGYLRELDKRTGGNHLFDANGNPIDKAKAQEYYQDMRTDGTMGYYHWTPGKLAAPVTPAQPVTTPGYSFDYYNEEVPGGDYPVGSLEWFNSLADVPAYDGAPKGSYEGVFGEAPTYTGPTATTATTATRGNSAVGANGEQTPVKTNGKNSWWDLGINPLRLVEPAVATGAVMSDLLGYTNTPTEFDYIPGFQPISYQPLGDYIAPEYFDTRYAANQAAQQAAATRNALMQSSAPNRYANLLAADYNAQIANGQLLRDAAMQDYDMMAKRKAFNRGTNQYNSETGLKTAIANQDARLKYAHAALQQARVNDEAATLASAARAQNLGNWAESWGNLGREIDARKDRDLYIAGAGRGMSLDEIKGWISPSRQLQYAKSLGYTDDEIKAAGIAAYGGKLKKKKKGLTY